MEVSGGEQELVRGGGELEADFREIILKNEGNQAKI